MTTFFTTLTVLSQILTILIAIGGLLAFFFRKWVGAWIDARFKRQLDIELKDIDQRFAEKLEEKKAALARSLATDLERLRAELATTSERTKRELDEEFRRKNQVFEKNSLHYEAFTSGFGDVISELYALDAEYVDDLDRVQNGLGEKLRASCLSKAHRMLVETQEKLQPHAVYENSDYVLRIAKLFADLSGFMADGARDRSRLDELAHEKSMIAIELRDELIGRL